MAKVYLGLGTNLGDKEQNLRDAVQKIEEQVGEVPDSGDILFYVKY